MARARIGMVDFLNTAPLYEVWKQTVRRPEWQVVEAVPSALNRMLYQGELDLGFISSAEYAAHPDRYRILADLSISANGPVGSVFLFSRVPFAELHQAPVLLSSQSKTSVCLVRIILEEFYGVQPRYTVGLASETAGDYQAVLSIGDEALCLAHGGDYPYRMDLGEEWRHRHGLPFVFAVWAVREEFCRGFPEEVRQIHRELVRCVGEGRKKLDLISVLAARKSGLPVEVCQRYLAGLEYDLNPAKQQSLTLFFQYLVRRNQADPQALALRICG